MKKVGNTSSNKTYNPQNKKPPLSIDADEAAGEMERFIRSKYMNNALASSRRHNTGSTESDETPPPLPPKTPSRFGLRSASSIFPLGSKSKKAAGRDTPTSPPGHTLRRNKTSQTFGASVHHDAEDGDDTERNLTKLRDMGFTDDQRNALVLKGVGGNLEKTIEALVRLGEGDSRTLTRSPNTLAPSRGSSLPTNRSLTPATSFSSHDASRPLPTTPSSSNPFDALDAPQFPQPLSSQSTGTLQNKNPYLTNNPFGLPSQPASAGLEQTFSNLSLAPPSQPLFPHHTGGMAVPQPPQNLYQQTMNPPLSSSAQNYAATGYNNSQNFQTYPQPAQQATPGYNPFFTNQQVQPPQQMQQPLAVATAGLPVNYGSNPFTRSPTRIQSPTLTQIPEQMQSNFYTPSPQQVTNPFFAQTTTQTMPQVQQQQYFQQPGQMQMQMQQTGIPQQPMGYATWSAPQRANKASIMALFDYTPAQTQQPQQQQQQPQQPQATSNPFQNQNGNNQAGYAASNNPFPSSSPQQQYQQPQQPQLAAAVSPAMGNKNPFASMGAGQQQQQYQPAPSLVDTSVAQQKPYNASRESMMAVGLEWANGRHSPDAFASLSASHTMR